jgi:hypothetical protein
VPACRVLLSVSGELSPPQLSFPFYVEKCTLLKDNMLCFSLKFVDVDALNSLDVATLMWSYIYI